MNSDPTRNTIAAVIPTHNRSVTLRRALESVVGQTRPPDEMIVVDDGSTDDTPDWMPRDFPGVTYISQQNTGVSAARNRGVAAARSLQVIPMAGSDSRGSLETGRGGFDRVVSRPGLEDQVLESNQAQQLLFDLHASSYAPETKRALGNRAPV